MWGRTADRNDEVRLLAMLVRAKLQPGNDLEDYEPPSQELAEWLRRKGDEAGDSREAQVRKFVAETGG